MQVTTTALMNPSNPFYTRISTRRFSLLERFHGFVLIVIALALLVSSVFFSAKVAIRDMDNK